MKKRISTLFFTLSFILFGAFNVVYAQPSNDTPCNATSFSTLPTPGSCSGGLQDGATESMSGQSTVGATGASPYVYQTGCSGGGPMASPALDTWYTFTATGTVLNVAIAGFPNASMGLWTGSCNNLQPWGCMNVPSGGSGSSTFTQIVAGQQYWIQVSGGNSTATDGSFTLTLDNDIDCNDCLLNASLTASPMPVNGGYTAGQTVTFCYTVSGWSQQNTNWFHGVQITYGAGWSGGITNPVPATTLQNIAGPGSDGDWLFFSTGIGNVNGTNWGPGFYFDTPDSGTSPSNNYGDNCNGSGCSWTFCWDMTVGTCTSGTSLAVTVNTSGDGESGSWISLACQDDNATNFSAIEICCSPPTIAPTNVTCFGGNNGAATATPGSGSSPWDFVWTNSSGTVISSTSNVTSNTVTGLVAGTYTVTTTDNVGCVSSATVTITQPTAVVASESHTNPPCFGGTTNATITASGGTPGYNVSWTGTTSGNPAGTEIAASGGTYSMVGLGAGVYNVTVTSVGGCTATTTVTVTTPTQTTITATPTHETCTGLNNGSILVSASGGTAGYNVSWSGAATGSPAGTEIAASGGSYNITGLPDGNYTVTVTNANGCVVTQNVTINPGVIIDANIVAEAAQCLTGNSFTYDGSTSTISSGTITSYTWNFGAGASPATGTGVTPPAVTYSTAGTATVTLTVSNGTCTNVQTMNVTINANPTVSTTPTNVLCNGGSTGAIAVVGSGATAGYNVSWTGTTTGNPVGTEIATSGGTYNMTGLPMGSYTITVTSANGCPVTTIVNITQPTVLTASDVETNVTCFGLTNGSAVITANGGTAPYNVSWTGPSSGNPAGTEIAASGGTYNITGLGAGVYTATVTDANNCTTTTTVNITQPTAVTASDVETNVTCFGGTNGSAVITASGGTAGYNVSWTGPSSGNPAGTEIAASGGTYNITGLGAGVYTVTITSVGGCTATTTVNITQPTAVVASDVETNVTCFGGTNGSAVITASGGTAGYNVSWTGTASGNPAGTEIAASGGTFTMTNLSAGSYTVTVTDANSCTATTTVNITQPATVTASDVETNVTCFGLLNGSGLITATGGTAPYNVSWTGTTSGNPAGTEIAASGGTYNLSGLGAGSYTVTITDANSCTATTTVNITQPTAITLTPSSTNTNCGASTGTASVVAAGGAGGYTYSWSPAPGGGQGTPIATGLAAASYTVTVTDINGCSESISIIVNGNSAPTASEVMPSHVNVSCNGGSNGSATITASAGTAPYNVSWTGPSSGNPAGNEITVAGGTFAIPNLVAGAYTVTVTDVGGCTATVNISITQPTIISLVQVPTNVTCNGGTNGSALITSSGGTAPYNVSWTGPTSGNPAGTEIAASGGTYTVTGMSAGAYTITITDANSCVQTIPVSITQPTAVVATNTVTNVLCNGGTTGSGTITATGGTAPYNVSWSGTTTGNPAGTEIAASGGTFTMTSLGVGTYNVTVTDANSCTGITTVTITEPAVISLVPSSTNANCGASDGTASVVASGGAGGYTYSWSPVPGGGQGTATATGLSATSYTVTVTDINTCTANSVIVVGSNLAPTASEVSHVNILCNAGTNGSILVTSTGGAPGYNVSWSGASTGNPGGTEIAASGGTYNISGLVAGAYTVTVTDQNGCPSTFNTTLTEPALLTATDIENNVLCFGGNNGSAIVSATGGTAPYNVSWTGTTTGNPAGTEIAVSGGTFGIPALSVGVYNITVTDANNCTAITTANITQPTAITITSATSINTLCFGDCNGSVNASATGGTGALVFNWVSVGTGAAQNGLCAGTYNLIVTDDNNCSANQTVIVGEPTAVSATTSTVNANCGSADGSATVTPFGGVGSYTFSWDTSPVQTGATATALIPGVYTVTVSDGNSCDFVTTATVGNNTAGSVNVVTDNNVSCFGASDGQMTATMTGGASPFTFSWNTSPVQTTATATNVGPGTYMVTVTDDNGCIVTGTTTVTEPPLLVVTTTPTDVNCPGGSDGAVTSTISGGTLNYDISWSNGPTTNNISGLTANTYTVTVTDGNGCIETSIATVAQPDPFDLVINTSDVTCKSACNGSANATVSGGTFPYDFIWNDPLTQITSNASSLCAGTYDVVVTDDHGCITNGNITINEPDEIVLTSTSVNANCGQADGSACVIATGGTGTYTYDWDSGQTTDCISNVLAGTYIVTVTDDNFCTETLAIVIPDLNGPSAEIIAQTNVSCNGLSDGSATVNMIGGTGIFTVQWDAAAGNQITPTASNLSVGTYGVTITDQVGCNASTSVIITEPTAIVFIQNVTHPTCYDYCDGVAWLGVTGGTTPYSFAWSDASNNPIGTNDDSLVNQCDGTYNLILSDDNGCTEIMSFTLTEPVQITGTTASTNVICNGDCDGTSTVTVNSGVAPFSYSWNDSSSQTTDLATGLCPGTYDVTVTDDDGCFEVFTSNITEPPLLTSSITVFGDVSCSGTCDGFAQVDFIGGVGPYQILWSNGSSNQVATNLCTGTYDVTIEDANGCTTTSTITISTPNPLVLSTTQVNLLCNDVCIGEGQVTATGGTTPYTYQWDNPTFDTDDLIDNQCAGTYTVLVTDDNGCTASSTITITEPAALDFTYTSQNSNCMQPNGQICTNVFGGVAPFFYQWDDPFLQTSACAFNITAGCYNLTLTDGNGCVKDSLICINDIAGPTVSLISTTDVTCQGAADGSIVVSASGGVGALDIEWQDGTGTSIAAFNDQTSVFTLSGDTYGIVVTDTAGCVAAMTEFIFEPNSVFAAVTSTTQPLCFGGCDGTATVSASGGDGNYSYQWNSGSNQTAAANSGLCAGTFSVVVSDGNGCSFTANTTIGQPTLITASTVSSTNVTCFGFCNGTTIVTASGATPPYSYNWTLGVSTGPTATNLCPNTYTTVITDSQGCFTALINTITEPGQLAVTTSTENSTCTQCNGEATAIVSGGTSPFNYQWSSGASLNTSVNTGLCPGAHTININDANGCTISGSATIIDEAGPTIIDLTFTQPLCSGLSNGTATVTTSGGTGQIIYNWTDPASQNTQTAFGLVAGNYCVSIQDQNGCPAAQCITVTQPTPLNAIGDLDATICFGDSTQVWASGQGGTQPYTINWSSPGMSGPGPIMVQPAVSTNYCFNVTDANGCASPNDCVVITVNPPLSMTITPPSEICDQGSITVTADASGGNGGPYTFSWTDESGNAIAGTQTGNSSSITVSPTTATWYIVTLSDGCTTPITDSTQISVNALPVLFVNVVDPEGCEPFPASFIVNSDIGVTYDYDFQCDGTIDLANSTTTTPSFTYPIAGVYDVCVTVTSADGCVTTSTNPGMVTVHPLPIADFSFTPDQTTIMNPTIDFTSASSGGDSLIWDFGDGFVLSGTTLMGNVPAGTHSDLTSGTYINPVHTYLDSGTYQITLTIINTTTGCSSTITQELIIEGDYILFAPNGFTPNGDGNNDFFLPQGIGIDRDHYKLLIFNRWGELIFETENPDLGWDGTYKGLMSQTDVYVWKIQTLDHKEVPHEYIGHVTLLK